VKLEELLMTKKNRSCSMIIAILLCSSAPVLAQTTPSTPERTPLKRTIGQAGEPEIIPSLIVMNARGASLQDGKLTLTGIAPNSIVFADRPVRAAGHSLTLRRTRLQCSQSRSRSWVLVWLGRPNEQEMHTAQNEIHHPKWRQPFGHGW
jgi:hypothetical protein